MIDKGEMTMDVKVGGQWVPLEAYKKLKRQKAEERIELICAAMIVLGMLAFAWRIAG